MRRFKIPELLLGSLLTVAIFATGALFAWRPYAAKTSGDIAEQGPAKKGESAKSPDSELVGPTWLTKDAAGFFAFISALVIGGQAVMFFIQLRYMRIGMRDATIAAKAAREGAIAAAEGARIARNAERPYLTPINPTLRNWGKVSENNLFENLEVHFDIENIGKGVGFVKSYAIAHEFCHDGKQGSLITAVRSDFGRVQIRSDARWSVDAAYENIQIESPERWREIIAYRLILYVYGHIRYSDLFGVIRKTGFMFEFIPDNADPSNSAFAMCPHPMWYDEEEPKT